MDAVNRCMALMCVVGRAAAGKVARVLARAWHRCGPTCWPCGPPAMLVPRGERRHGGMQAVTACADGVSVACEHFAACFAGPVAAAGEMS